MSTVGKVCLVLTLLLLLLVLAPIPGKFGGWAPKALLFHNQWSTKLRDTKQKTLDSVASNREARQEFNKAMADVAGLTIGWDKFWNVPARSPQAPAGTPTVAKKNGFLTLFNIGSDNGLTNLEYVDDDGQTKTAMPIVHAFFGGPEGFRYAGEFRAMEIVPQQATLQPVRPISAQEFANWNPNAAWRLRTIIPPGHQTTIDELDSHKLRIFELTRQMGVNIERQQTLLGKAQEALEVREGELLGGLDRVEVPTRPEFTAGLQQVNENVEEQRNQLLLELDALRRRIKAEYAQRDAAVSSLNQLISKLPGAEVHYAEATPVSAVAE